MSSLLASATSEHVDQTVFSDDLGLGLYGVALLGAGAGDGQLDQIADDGLDIAADIADLGELGGFDLDERRVGELGQPPGDLGLAAARWPDHQDVLGQHFFAQAVGQLLPPPAVAQRDGNGALGVALANDETVEFGNDFPR